MAPNSYRSRTSLLPNKKNAGRRAIRADVATQRQLQFWLGASRGRPRGSSLLCSGGAAALGRQVDELVAGLRQLRDGHAASLADELGHRVQLLWRDGDELPPVVNHTCGGDEGEGGGAVRRGDGLRWSERGGSGR